MVVMAVWLVAPGAALAQNVIGGTEELEFDRPESWGMKFFASVSLLTSMGVPERMGAGTIDLGFEGGFVPQLSEEQRRIGFNGTKLENLNRSHFFGRVRGHIGLSESTRLELAYLPPVDIGGIKPNLFAIGVGRPFSIAEHWQLGARGYFQFGTLEGDITYGEDEAAAGDDPDRNPFMCEAPSNDKLGQKVYGAELTAGYISDSKFRPYAGLAFNYLDLDFQVDALYAGLIDTTEQFTNGGTISVTAGANYIATDKWRITGEVFYTWLSVVRPPSMTSANDGLLNFRFFVSYRIR
jgi:hypothetical protein